MSIFLSGGILKNEPTQSVKQCFINTNFSNISVYLPVLFQDGMTWGEWLSSDFYTEWPRSDNNYVYKVHKNPDDDNCLYFGAPGYSIGKMRKDGNAIFETSKIVSEYKYENYV